MTQHSDDGSTTPPPVDEATRLLIRKDVAGGKTYESIYNKSCFSANTKSGVTSLTGESQADTRTTSTSQQVAVAEAHAAAAHDEDVVARADVVAARDEVVAARADVAAARADVAVARADATANERALIAAGKAEEAMAMVRDFMLDRGVGPL